MINGEIAKMKMMNSDVQNEMNVNTQIMMRQAIRRNTRSQETASTKSSVLHCLQSETGKNKLRPLTLHLTDRSYI